MGAKSVNLPVSQSERSDSEQTGEQRYEGDADQSDTATGHQLLHTLGLGTGVVVAVTFQQIDDTPNAQTGTQSDNEGLQNTNSGIEKCQIFSSLKWLRAGC